VEAKHRIGIWGAGAVGHMLAYLLSHYCQVRLQMVGRQGPQSLASELFWGDLSAQLNIPKIDPLEPELVLVALKAYDLYEALAKHLPTLQPGTVVVLLSNGYIEPVIAPLRNQYPDLIWRKGIVTKGIKLDGQGRFRMGPEGHVIWGGKTAATPVETYCFDQLASYGWSWSSSACDLRRSKWFFNSVLNTLCAVYRLPRNGDALDLFEADLEALAKEAYALGQELWPDWDFSWDFLWWELRRLIQMTAENENSMARDFRLGRRTEAESLSGCLSLSARADSYPLLQDFHRKISSKVFV
jgi:2-dehydropantoate 2-reductase